MSLLKTQRSWSLKNWLNQTFLIEKLNNPMGYLMGAGIGLFLAIVLSVLPLKLGALFVIGLIGIPAVLYCFADIHFGVLILMVWGAAMSFIGKFTDAPIGTTIDGMILLLLFGLLVRLVKERDFSFLKSPITIFILFWIYYNMLEVLNPWAQSRMAWVYTVRTVALYLSVYFVACHAMSSLAKVKSVVKTILFIAFISAFYALKQEYIGYTSSEMAWLHADPKRFELIFQWSRLRVFSFYSDPTTFGILMAYMSVFCIALLFGPYKNWQKGIIGFGIVCMFLGMGYAGSRTPFVLVPAGVFFFMVLTFRRETIFALIFMIILGIGFTLKSTSNAVIWRIQSAFKPSEDASMQLRLANQAKIQPYVQTHPIGAGLGSTGMWGKRFTPDSWLASFAHDSLYVRIAVEAGWIGLIIYLMLTMAALWQGIHYYLRVKDPLIKNLYLAITSAVFILALANYPQEAVTLPPTSLIFYVMLAALVRLKDFDPNFSTKPKGGI